MAGLSAEGLTINRLPDIITELKQEARELFQDLVPEGDVVNTEDITVLGRMIGVVAPSYADLWEAIQQVYDAFNPSAASGVALDNLVQYTGITRYPPSASTATCLFTGAIGTVIPAGSLIKSPVSRNVFETPTDITISADSASGITISVPTIQNSTAYTITYVAGASTSVVTYTSDASASLNEILEGLVSVIESAHPLLSAQVFGTSVIVDRANVFSTANFSVSANLLITHAKRVGSTVCQTLGPLQQDANTLTLIATPVLGWTEVTNPSAASAGRLLETDEELRERFRNTKFERSSNILDSLYSALMNTDSVTEVRVYENDTNATNALGIPAHTFMPIVVGGGDTEVASVIWKNKPMGILSFGNTTIPILDSQNEPHDISFERANPVPVLISFEIVTDEDVFPGDGVEQIKQALVDHGTTVLGIGDDVIYSRLFTPINSVPGHYVSGTMQIGRTVGTMGTSNVAIAFNEIASLSAANITITVA